MPSFLTVKEAARLTAKSPSSIRRIIYRVLEAPHHPDRPYIQPSVEDVQEFRLKGENFAWRISEELLSREMPPEAATEEGTEKSSGRRLPESESALLSMLRKELDIKNQQITQQADMLATQMKLIEGLSERLREGNLLIGSLQQQRVLSDGKAQVHSKPVEAQVKPPQQRTAQAPAKPEAKIQTKTPSKIPQTPPKPKRGFFARMFR